MVSVGSGVHESCELIIQAVINRCLYAINRIIHTSSFIDMM